MNKKENKERLEQAIDRLGEEFPKLNWNFRPDPLGGSNSLISQWLGSEDEEVMACVFKGKRIHEQFHRQDFFFVNFAYRGDYRALSAQSDNEINLQEGDCYIGQPYSGYALRGDSPEDIVIVGLLIRKETFFNEYLAPLSSDPDLLHFFLEPKENRFSDEFIHLTVPPDSPIWVLLEQIITEYANRQEDTQKILKPMIFTVMMLLTRVYKSRPADGKPQSIAEQMSAYMDTRLENITLGDLAARFGYHPNYISALIRRETGHTFSQMLLEKRMKRARLLLESTKLSVSRVAEMTGYGSSSNFYKAYRRYYGVSPREKRSE